MQCFEQTSWIAVMIYSIEISGPSKRGLFGCIVHYCWGIGWICSSGVGCSVLPKFRDFWFFKKIVCQKGRYKEAWGKFQKILIKIVGNFRKNIKIFSSSFLKIRVKKLLKDFSGTAYCLVAYLVPDWVDYSIISSIFVFFLLPGVYFIPPSIVYLFRAKKYFQG